MKIQFHKRILEFKLLLSEVRGQLSSVVRRPWSDNYEDTISQKNIGI